MKSSYLAAGIVVVLIVAVAFAVIRARMSQPSSTNPTPTPIEQASVESIAASKHTPAKTVVVDIVTLKNPGFVVIHEINNGQVGNVLGASSILSAGTHENVVVEISRKSIDGEELIAMIHADNGNGKFDSEAEDPAANDASGNPVTTKFLVSNETNGFQTPATGLGEDSEE
jgi:hypothetical protein